MSSRRDYDDANRTLVRSVAMSRPDRGYQMPAEDVSEVRSGPAGV
jgi:hypothetical protein